MDSILVERPKASDHKISTSDDFELCYLRHQYFRRVNYNPTPEDMAPYSGIVNHFTKKTFWSNYGLFQMVGMLEDDVVNIGQVHLVSFLGLYSLEKDEKKKKEWQINFALNENRDPAAADMSQKNKANFTLFFKQRMEDLVRVCRQKVRNIKGQSLEEFVVFCGPSKPPKQMKKLLRSHEEFGYKKIDFPTFKSIKKKANVSNDAKVFIFGDIWYIAIPVDQKDLEFQDLVNSEYNPFENVHNMRPDVFYEEQESNHLMEKFNQKSDLRKKIILRNFIAKNRYKRQYKKEISAAKKLLKTLGE